jgi:hypothetical protein
LNFLDLQQAVYDLISAHPTFAALAPQTVFLDLGNVKSQVEAALAQDPDQPIGPGYAIAVWPPVAGTTTMEYEAGQTPVESRIVVRLEINPKTLTARQAAHDADSTLPDCGQWVNGMIKDIAAAVLEADPELGGLKFGLAKDFYELMNFDEGLLAFHLRFTRMAVFGS